MNVKYQGFRKQNKDGIKIQNVTLLMALGILADQFDFTAQELRWFMEDYNKLADSLAEKHDNLRDIERELSRLYGLSVR